MKKLLRVGALASALIFSSGFGNDAHAARDKPAPIAGYITIPKNMPEYRAGYDIEGPFGINAGKVVWSIKSTDTTIESKLDIYFAPFLQNIPRVKLGDKHTIFSRSVYDPSVPEKVRMVDYTSGGSGTNFSYGAHYWEEDGRIKEYCHMNGKSQKCEHHPKRLKPDLFLPLASITYLDDVITDGERVNAVSIDAQFSGNEEKITLEELSGRPKSGIHEYNVRNIGRLLGQTKLTAKVFMQDPYSPHSRKEPVKLSIRYAGITFHIKNKAVKHK